MRSGGTELSCLGPPRVALPDKVVADDAAEGWQAHLACDPREDEESFVVFFCPSCAEREFGDWVEDEERA